MVAVNDLAQASYLSEELTRHRRAITALERNAPISALTVGSVTVPLRDMPYPEQMGQAISAALQARVQELQQELEQLGVTDFEPPGPRAAPVRAEAAPPPPTPGHPAPPRRK